MTGVRFFKFLVVGLGGVFVNYLVMIVLVEVCGFQSHILKNIANLTALEVSMFNNFIFNRMWTWVDAPKKHLVMQFISFNLASYPGILLRMAIFAILDMIGIHYTINVAVGIIISTILNFVMYDKFVFKRV